MNFIYYYDNKCHDVKDILLKKYYVKKQKKIIIPQGIKNFTEIFGINNKTHIDNYLLIDIDNKKCKIYETDKNEYKFNIYIDIKISVILNVYKRLDYLDEQINAVYNQSIKPHEIIIWNNSLTILNWPQKLDVPLIIFNSSKNMGVWSRFFCSANATGNYVVFFDDDTMPGKKFFENCIECMCIKKGLYGTTGYVFSCEGYFKYNNRIGWQLGNDNIEEVDIIGHAWFLKKKWMKYFYNELPDITKYPTCGEDFHLSFTLKKYGNIKSYIVKQPKGDYDLYGSIKGAIYGEDGNGISSEYGSYEKFEEIYKYYVDILKFPLLIYNNNAMYTLFKKIKNIKNKYYTNDKHIIN